MYVDLIGKFECVIIFKIIFSPCTTGVYAHFYVIFGITILTKFYPRGINSGDSARGPEETYIFKRSVVLLKFFKS